MIGRLFVVETVENDFEINVRLILNGVWFLQHIVFCVYVFKLFSNLQVPITVRLSHNYKIGFFVITKLHTMRSCFVTFFSTNVFFFIFGPKYVKIPVFEIITFFHICLTRVHVSSKFDEYYLKFLIFKYLKTHYCNYCSRRILNTFHV